MLRDAIRTPAIRQMMGTWELRVPLADFVKYTRDRQRAIDEGYARRAPAS